MNLKIIWSFFLVKFDLSSYTFKFVIVYNIFCNNLKLLKIEFVYRLKLIFGDNIERMYLNLNNIETSTQMYFNLQIKIHRNPQKTTLLTLTNPKFNSPKT